MDATTDTLLDGLGFPEGPRWREGRLYFSDFHHRCVRSVTTTGEVEIVLELEDAPSGLGWTPEGDLMVVSIMQRRLLRITASGIETVADLSPWTVMGANDMVVDGTGRAYIGNFGYDFMAGETPRPTALVRVEPDGAVTTEAAGVICPNGMVIDEERRLLVVAETFAHRLTAFDIDDDGSLRGGRVFAAFDDDVDPDGICLDADGQIWVATARTPEVFRVADGGHVSDRVRLGSGNTSYAVMLGGEDGRTLFVCSAPGLMPAATGSGRIEICRVDVPHAGRP